MIRMKPEMQFSGKTCSLACLRPLIPSSAQKEIIMSRVRGMILLRGTLLKMSETTQKKEGIHMKEQNGQVVTYRVIYQISK
jgi:hypothetical protein